jgi:hypothetical protein
MMHSIGVLADQHNSSLIKLGKMVLVGDILIYLNGLDH